MKKAAILHALALSTLASGNIFNSDGEDVKLVDDSLPFMPAAYPLHDLALPSMSGKKISKNRKYKTTAVQVKRAARKRKNQLKHKRHLKNK